MHIIRNAMGNRDNLYTLSDMVEFDEGYYEIATAKNIKLKHGKRSCNSGISTSRRYSNRKEKQGV